MKYSLWWLVSKSMGKVSSSPYSNFLHNTQNSNLVSHYGSKKFIQIVHLVKCHEESFNQNNESDQISLDT